MWLSTEDHLGAITEIEEGPDRVIAVVIGSLMDQFVSDALRGEFGWNNTKYASSIKNELFSEDGGAIGSFGPKIGLAFLMGLISEDAHHDLRTISKIRNRFSHLHNINNFEKETIISLSNNFRLIKELVTEASSTMSVNGGPHKSFSTFCQSTNKYGVRKVWLQLVDHKAQMIDAKGKFLTTAKLLYAAFIISNEGKKNKPII